MEEKNVEERKQELNEESKNIYNSEEELARINEEVKVYLLFYLKSASLEKREFGKS
jgi:hypothetical protein